MEKNKLEKILEICEKVAMEDKLSHIFPCILIREDNQVEVSLSN